MLGQDSKISTSLESKLKNYLNLYWLRPENGLMMAFKSKAFEKLKIESPSLEISCGDGLFFAIHSDGIFDENFDYFKSTRAKQFTQDSIDKSTKYADLYDTCNENYTVPYVQKPTIQFDYGTDWKQGLLDKASKANTHKNLILHDNNNIPFPFSDNFFQTIYSNSIYHTASKANSDKLLSEIYRITKPGGSVGLEVLTPFWFDTLVEMEKYFDEDAIGIFDRKRRAIMPGRQTHAEWNEKIKRAGFKIDEAISVYPNKILLDIYNVGLRPIAHLLIQMADNLSLEERRRIKQEWVNIFYRMFKPLLSVNQSYTLDNSPYIYYLLKKE